MKKSVTIVCVFKKKNKEYHSLIFVEAETTRKRCLSFRTLSYFGIFLCKLILNLQTREIKEKNIFLLISPGVNKRHSLGEVWDEWKQLKQ